MFLLLQLLCLREGCQKKWGVVVVVVVGVGWSLESVNTGTAGASHSQSIPRSVCVPLTRRSLWTLSAALFLSSQITAFQSGSSPRHGSAGRRRHLGSCSGNVKKLVRRGEVALRPGSTRFFFFSPHSCWHFFQMSNRSPGTSYTRPSGRTLGECQERDRESPRKAADKVQRPLASLSAGRRGKEMSRFSDDLVTLHLAIVRNLVLCSVS